MFHNGSTSHFSSRSQNFHNNLLHNDENAQTSKSLRKKGLGNINSRSFNENENNVSFKTPLAKGSRKDINHSTSRRRALGDISNRKGQNGSTNEGGTFTRKGLGQSKSKGGIEIYTSRKSATVQKSTQPSEKKLTARDLNIRSSTNDTQKKSVSFAIHKNVVEKMEPDASVQIDSEPVLNTSLLDDLDDIEICAGRTGAEEQALLKKMGYFDDCNLSIDFDALDMIRRGEEERIQKNLEKRLQQIAVTEEHLELEKKLLGEMQKLEDEGIIAVFEDDDVDNHFDIGSDDTFSFERYNCDDQDLISGLDDISL